MKSSHIFEIVELEPNDAGTLLPLLEQVQSLHVRAHPDIFRRDASIDDRIDFLRDLISKSEVKALAVRAANGSILGYLIYEVQLIRETTLKSPRRIGHLHQIVVDEAMRGRGVGSKLVEDMKSRLRAEGVSKVSSDFYAFNEPSAAMMKAAGMRPLKITVEGDL